MLRTPTTLTARELMAQYGISENTAWRWRKDGIPNRNAVKKQSYNDQKAAAQQTPGGVAPDAGTVTPPGAAGPQVTVKGDETPKAPVSFKDRILGKFSQAQPAAAAPAKKPAARGSGKRQENLVTTAMPSIVCAFIATYSRDLVHDPYKMCAPSQDEVTGMLGPLFDILGREVELTGKASQNTIDLINSLLCGMMYGFRAFMTYRQIKELEPPANGQSNTTVNSPITGLGSQATAPARPNGYNDSRARSAIHDIATEADAEGSNTNSDDGDTEGVNPEAQLISHMFRRDIEGRKRLGLLPTGV